MRVTVYHLNNLIPLNYNTGFMNRHSLPVIVESDLSKVLLPAGSFNTTLDSYALPTHVDEFDAPASVLY